MFAFSTHKNTRLEYSPFYLQYSIESVLPSTIIIVQEISLTNIKLKTAWLERRTHVQNLQQYRTNAAEKYRRAIERLADHRDDAAFETPIVPGDLVMRDVLTLNRNYTLSGTVLSS